MPSIRCTFRRDGEQIAEHTGDGPHESFAKRNAISQFDWENYDDDVTVSCW
jgi:hypothetical protein